MKFEIEGRFEAGVVFRFLPEEPGGGRQIEQERSIGQQPPGCDRDDPAEDFEIHPPTVALVGHRGISETGTDDDATCGKGRADHLGDVLGARRIEEERIGHRVDRCAAVGHQQLIELVAEWRPSRLTGQEYLVPAFSERGRESPGLERLAGAVGPLEGDEMA